MVPRRFILGGLICAAGVAGASSARAEGVGVLVLAGDRASGEALARAIGGAIGTERPRVTLDPIGEASAALAAGAVPIGLLPKFRAVRAQVADGWRAYLQVSIEFAASRLATARTEAEALVPLPGGLELYADISLRLGAVLAHLGRVDEARAALRLALTLDPDRPVTLAEFSPDVLEEVEAVRLLRPPSQRVRIASEPADATISVDGLPMGRGTIEIDLARGQHVIVARATNHIALAQAVAVDDAHSVFALRLEEDAAAMRLADPSGELAPLVETALTFGELDEIVVVESVVAHGSQALVVQRCVGIPATCSATVELGYPDAAGLAAAAKEAWASVRVGELRYPPKRRGEVDRAPQPRRCEPCRSPVVWGGVAAVAVVGVVLAVVLTGSRPLPVVTVNAADFTR
ncbi:MAG: tetratricopeptide repeat protein [Proteobacteria bacterium]|nr:tetratricopeptide repeat protein [Pseudomonadota bacterium]